MVSAGMTTERWAQVKQLMQAALDVPDAERAAWLETAAGGDAALRGEVESLLMAHRDASGFLDAPAPLPEPPASPCLPPGTRIGPYQIVSTASIGVVTSTLGYDKAEDMLRDAGVPYIVVFTDPTTGGVSASYAMLGDVHIAEPGALIGFAGQRVIAQTMREHLPEGFQRAEYLLEHGMVDMVVHRHQMRETLSRVVHLLMKRTRPKTRISPPAVITASASQVPARPGGSAS